MNPQKNIVKQGYLESFTNPSNNKSLWKRRYFLLYGTSERNKSRLDWYGSHEEYEQSTQLRKTLYLEEIRGVEVCQMESHSNTFQVSTVRRNEPFFYAASSKDEATQWVESFKRLLVEKDRSDVYCHTRDMEDCAGEGIYANQIIPSHESGIRFHVSLGDTDAAKRIELADNKFDLLVYSSHMTLVEPDCEEAVQVWPFRFIRRYGRSKTTFTFEAGRKCASGEGVFIFHTNEADTIFKSILANTNQKGSEKTSESGASAAGPDGPPALPQRKYDEEKYCDLTDVSAMKEHGSKTVLPKNKKPNITPKPQKIKTLDHPKASSAQANSVTTERPPMSVDYSEVVDAKSSPGVIYESHYDEPEPFGNDGSPMKMSQIVTKMKRITTAVSKIPSIAAPSNPAYDDVEPKFQGGKPKINALIDEDDMLNCSEYGRLVVKKVPSNRPLPSAPEEDVYDEVMMR